MTTSKKLHIQQDTMARVLIRQGGGSMILQDCQVYSNDSDEKDIVMVLQDKKSDTKVEIHFSKYTVQS